ncbi:uncharacterized protein METZ01_LOCUS329075, partial [marine metagenome]
MELDICSLGNALLDVQFSIDDNFKDQLKELSIPFGLMTLIERQEQEKLIKKLKAQYGEPLLDCGGSATNSLIAASNFGSTCYYTFKVSDDNAGKAYKENLLFNNIRHKVQTSKLNLPTGQCLVMVSPDAERTMCTYLGVSSSLNCEDLDNSAIKNSKYLFIEGYLVTSQSALKASIKAIKIAKKNGVKVALSLSAANIVDSFRDEIRGLIDLKCDLLFGNELEVLTYTKEKNVDKAERNLRDISETFCITLGSRGSLSWDGESSKYIEGYKANAIDTNGAGDMFAGAVLHLIT